MKEPNPSPNRSTFPFRAGAIDIGSNAIRLLTVEVSAPGEWRQLESSRLSLRLGHEVFLNGRLSPATMNEAVAGLSRFREIMGSLGISRYRAVATSAIRESRNGREFARRARNETGIDVEIINGAEEARIVYLAVRRRIPLGGGTWLLVDLGGGSLEVSLITENGIISTESRAVGSVRLLEELKGNPEEPQAFARLLEEYISSFRFGSSLRLENISGLIATGGNIESLARLGRAEERGPGVSALSLERLGEITVTLLGLSYRERVVRLGLNEDRADVIVPAAVIYSRIAELAGAKEFLVPNVGVREGLILDIIEKGSGRGDDELREHSQSWETAVNLGRKYLFEEGHALQVARLAVSLFDQLASLHGLGSEDRRLLAVAAILHDIGTFISYNRHHKHSYYLIAESELTGFTSRERLIVALVARYHRKSEPEADHSPFGRLSVGERRRVAILAGIVRIADALDREHKQRIKAVRVEVREEAVVLHAEGRGDLILESWGIEKKSRLFAKLFKRGIRLQRAERPSIG